MIETNVDRNLFEARFWDAQADTTKSFRNLFYEEVNNYLWDLILQEVGDLQNKRVLFVGCGTASAATKTMLECGAEIWCVDISPSSLHRLMRHPFGELKSKIHPVVCDAEDMPFEDDCFDVVVGKAIVHHLDIPKFLPEVWRVCKDEGLMVFSEPLGSNPFLNLFRWLTPKSRVPTEHPLKPFEVTLIRSYCQSMNSTFSFFLSMIALPFYAINRPHFADKCLKFFSAIDRVLFLILPPTRWMAWNVTVRGRVSKPYPTW